MEEKIKKIFCALFRHSHIHTTFLGYQYCARCEVQVGDSLGGFYMDKQGVWVGHNCEECRDNYKKLGFVDKFLCSNPFTKEENYK